MVFGDSMDSSQYVPEAEKECRGKFSRHGRSFKQELWGSLRSVSEGFAIMHEQNANPYLSEYRQQYINKLVPKPRTPTLPLPNPSNKEEKAWKDDAEFDDDDDVDSEEVEEEVADNADTRVLFISNSPPKPPPVPEQPGLEEDKLPPDEEIFSSSKHLAKYHIAPIGPEEIALVESFKDSRAFLVRAATTIPYNIYETETKASYTAKSLCYRTPPRNGISNASAVFNVAEGFTRTVEPILADDHIAIANAIDVQLTPTTAPAPTSPVRAGVSVVLFNIGNDVPASQMIVTVPPPTPMPSSPTPTPTRAPAPAPAQALALAPTPIIEIHSDEHLTPTKKTIRTIPTPRKVVSSSSALVPKFGRSSGSIPASEKILETSRQVPYETRKFETTAKAAYRAVVTSRGRKEPTRPKSAPPNPPPQPLRSFPHCVRSKLPKQRREHADLQLLPDPEGMKTIMGTAKTASIASSKRKSGSGWGAGWASDTLQRKVPVARTVQGPPKEETTVSASFGECMSAVRDLLVDDLGAKALEGVGKTTAPKPAENFFFHAIKT